LKEERVEDRAKALLKTMDLEETAESIQKAKENLKSLEKSFDPLEAQRAGRTSVYGQPIVPQQIGTAYSQDITTIPLDISRFKE